jgi:REP element-mobilizing transposase RayT
MPLRKDPLIPGMYYHIFNRGINSETIFRSERNYYFFLRKIREIIIPQAATIIAYVLMPTHYHLLVQITREDFSSSLGRLINSYTKACNQEWGRTGPLFEGRFKAKHIDTDKYLLELSRYIHLNPVSAQLVKKPEQWPHSSYSNFIGDKNDFLVLTDNIYSYFDNIDSRIEYQNFVEAGLCSKTNDISHLLFD